jgi:SMC interacting uncharacterized protein involved in chromosome segregation
MIELEVYKKSDFYEDYISSQKEYYERENADAYFAEKIAEKDKEIAELKAKLDEKESWVKMLGEGEAALSLDLEKTKAKLEDVNELVKESKELLKESQKMHQRCANNASKQIRRLKRALYKACAEWALSTLSWLDCIDQGNPVKWGEMRRKCLEKVEEYK